MLVGQQLGPFLIEKELGAGAMGAVYRGKYVKTGQVVAVKVMAPGLGTSGGSSADRFKREAEILKQLNHPNIVRLFGHGRHHGTPYFAMEYIKGESLDRIMARRDRMTWEEVVDVGQQLCAALQHAHEAGIVHRDLKPSNLMILPDGTLKLTDFGIAKDLDVTALTGANCTVGTAAYMSPEQCKGEPLTHKSDLYSLGVVLYELVTGKKPFTAENAMEMFLLHVQGPFERPSRVALEVPVWLDNLICQLLEKKPEQRPFDAAMVSRVLGSIQEKVEAQQSAGVDVARARVMDRPKGQRNPSDEDRAAARTLLGKKARKKAKKRLHQSVWVQALGLLLVLAGIIAVLVLVLQPPSAEKLHAQAKKLMTSDREDDWDRGRDGPVKDFLARFGQANDEKTKKLAAEVQQWADAYDIRRHEQLMDRYVRHETQKKGLAVEAQSAEEKQTFDAALAEYEGNRDKAVKLWQQVLQDGTARMMLVARKHLDMLAEIDRTEDRLWDLRTSVVRNQRTEPQLDDLERQAFLAVRQERLGDLAGAQRRYQRLRDAARKDAAQHFWSLFAAARSRKLKDRLSEKPQDDKARLAVVEKVVADVGKEQEAKKTSLLDLRVRLQDVVVLYDKDPEMAEPVKKARELIAKIDATLPRKSR
jgi:serine/threonine-protein kinase